MGKKRAEQALGKSVEKELDERVEKAIDSEYAIIEAAAKHKDKNVAATLAANGAPAAALKKEWRTEAKSEVVKKKTRASLEPQVKADLLKKEMQKIKPTVRKELYEKFNDEEMAKEKAAEPKTVSNLKTTIFNKLKAEKMKVLHKDAKTDLLKQKMAAVENDKSVAVTKMEKEGVEKAVKDKVEPCRRQTLSKMWQRNSLKL